MKKIKRNTVKIETFLGTYHKALATKDFIYFVNYEEGDDNGATKMYNVNTGELISDNYLATNSLFQDILSEKWYFISDSMRYNAIHMILNDSELILEGVELKNHEGEFYVMHNPSAWGNCYAFQGEKEPTKLVRFKINGVQDEIAKDYREEILNYRLVNPTDEDFVTLGDIFMYGKFHNEIKG